jgi:hypothetical protein
MSALYNKACDFSHGLFTLPSFLQLSLGLSPVGAGLLMIPQAAGALLGKGLVNVMLPRTGLRAFVLGNTIMLGLMVASFSLIHQGFARLPMVAMFALYGAVNSMQFTALNSMLVIGLDRSQAGSGNTLLSIIAQISGSAGATLGAALLALFALAAGGGGFRPATLIDPAIFQKSFLAIGLVILAATLAIRRLSDDYGLPAGAIRTIRPEQA